MVESIFAFVLMPFDTKFDDVYRLGIQAAAEELGVIAQRVDEQVFHKEGILERIYNQIEAADFIIAEMTGKNPNVFYEVGYAHAKAKPCVLITEKAEDIPFDLKHQRHIVYGSSISTLKKLLKTDISALKDEVAAKEKPIVAKLAKVDGDLATTKTSATAKVTLYFDLNNNTTSISPVIEAMYFYTGNGWKYLQEGQECAQTGSDIREFQRRHLIRPPVARLTNNGWAQVKLIGEKVLGYSWRGFAIKDSYQLSGKALMRIVTARDIFDYPINIDVEVSEFPF